VILGRDLLEQSPSDIKFSDRTMPWQEATIPMKKADERTTKMSVKPSSNAMKQGISTKQLKEPWKF
jgi:hypothetical protein